MEDTSEKNSSKRITVGLLAHVDAGKTTLSEGILYSCGAIRKLGRVDHRDAYLDTFALERERGITIFSKQAQVHFAGTEVTILDTPGHVDFSAEMERTLQVLDYAILVISGADGVQSHVETLWRLLSRYRIPVFLFVNKMDQPGTEKERLLRELEERLDSHCVDFSGDRDPEAFQESLAMCEEERLEAYLAGEMAGDEEIRRLIRERRVFPCYFGSALKLDGVEELMEGLCRFSLTPEYPPEFGARVYKITRDAQGTRLTHMKITGGTLRVRDVLRGRAAAGTAPGQTAPEDWEQKVSQIRIYSGADYTAVQEAKAGTVCAVAGLDHTYAGEGLGAEQEAEVPLLEPVLSYRVELPEGADVHRVFRQLRMLEEEEPELHIAWDEKNAEIHAQLMGEVQTEILCGIIRERFGIDVAFREGSIVYRETIAEPVVGMGHFEPLRHYAEVHLLMEPAERGSGLQFESVCSEDELDGNWQRLILTHLEERSHPGVLTGSDITDMKITLVAGRAHQKHTEGGDFRQATYRAVRQGLCRARCVLLEPVYEFRLEVPADSVGRALSDIQRMYGTAEPIQSGREIAVITGKAPVVTMQGYQSEVLAYSRGRGRLFCRMKGYEECHNAQEVIEQRGYDAQADIDNPCGSVFCAHGAGFLVGWEQVPEYVHIPGTDAFAAAARENLRAQGISFEETADVAGAGEDRKDRGTERVSSASLTASDEELREIFERTYGPVRRERNRFLYGKSRGETERGETRGGTENRVSMEMRAGTRRNSAPREEYLLVDGYNIIFAWDELKSLAKQNLESARGRLLDLMSNYQGYKKNRLIVVFDAYRVTGHATEILTYHNIYVVFTKEAETADQYIEKAVREFGKDYHVTVATSDALEQVIILGAGATRLSARGLLEELERMGEDLRQNYLEAPQKGGKTYLLDGREEIRDQIREEKEKNQK